MYVSKEWVTECLKHYGVVLTGAKAHWCLDFDQLPIDETCKEIEYCHCFDNEEEDGESKEERLREVIESEYRVCDSIIESIREIVEADHEEGSLLHIKHLLQYHQAWKNNK